MLEIEKGRHWSPTNFIPQKKLVMVKVGRGVDLSKVQSALVNGTAVEISYNELQDDGYAILSKPMEGKELSNIMASGFRIVRKDPHDPIREYERQALHYKKVISKPENITIHKIQMDG